MTIAEALETLPVEVRAAIVGEALGVPGATPVTWHPAAIPAGAGDATAGTFRVVGTARAAGETRPWAAVVKVLRRWAGTAPGGADPAAWRFWPREALVYRSGLAAGVPGGFAAARCLRVDLGADEAWIWLEALAEEAPRPWPAARLRLAARHLGRFQGAFAAGRPLPDEPWLPRRWLREYVEACAPYVAHLAAGTGHPLAAYAWPSGVREDLLRLWGERERFLAALDALPQTLRHGDVNLGNLFARHDARGEPETTAIDWEFVARGAIGEDLIGLLRARTRVQEGLPPAALQALVLDGYLDGLRDAGWRGPADAVRLGLAASAALRDAFQTLAFEYLDADRLPTTLARLGGTREGWCDAFAGRMRAATARADEARALLGA